MPCSMQQLQLGEPVCPKLVHEIAQSLQDLSTLHLTCTCPGNTHHCDQQASRTDMQCTSADMVSRAYLHKVDGLAHLGSSHFE